MPQNAQFFHFGNSEFYLGTRRRSNDNAMCKIELYLHKKLLRWEETRKSLFTRTYG